MATTAELIFWIVATIVVIGGILIAAKGKGSGVEITEFKLRDWANRDKGWGE